jgi:hypothetical protein
VELQAIKNVVTSKLGRQLLTVQKHSPVIMFGAGIVGVVATAVLASRATLKLDDILDDHDKMIDKISNFQHQDYSDDNRKKDKVVQYVHTGMKMAKTYAPAVLVGAASIVCLTTSHVVLTKRNASLAAAYAVLDRGFKQYRERVVGELGAGKDMEFRYDMEDHTVVEETPEGPITKNIKRPSKKNLSVYARIFDRDNKHWKSDPHYNQMFIACQQNWANELLRARGHVFLNEVYDMLGFQRSREGAVVGWILGNPEGDSFIDFGVFDDDVYSGLLFVNGDEPSVLVDFNVDGVVWNKI